MRKTTEDKRFIEVSFPIKEVGEESAREKYIRRGNISAIHIWWARKPLSVSRATNYASLIPAPKNIEEWKETRKFIIELSKWDNSLNKSIINKARNNILIYYKGSPPKVLDPFGGGGSIPLEAARLGCETYSNDYNPISVFLQKATLEYPKNFEFRQDWGELNPQETSKLFSDVHKWSRIILENVSKEIQQYYPKDSDNSIPVGYIWSRTVLCQNPSCCTEIPLIRQFWLSKRANNVALYMYIENKKILFKIIGDSYEPFPPNYNPSKGTIEKAIVTCPVCGNVIDDKELRKIFQSGKSSQKMMAVVLQSNKNGKKFRIATEKDLEVYKKVKSNLESKRKLFLDRYGIDPIPDELIPTPCHDVDRPPMYGMLRWGDLFNDRQKLALIKFTEEILESYPKMSNEYKDKLYVNTIYNILNLALDKLIMFSSSNCTWKPTTTQVISAFLGRQAIPMTWDYFEMNPISGTSASWRNLIGVIEDSFNILSFDNPVKVTHGSATNLPYPDNYFDAIFTDPPYYDNVGYSSLSDFFYVWLKRSLGKVYPELFSTVLTPKSKEIIAEPYRQGGKKAAKEFFESMLKGAFQEIFRVLKPGGITTIVYAHKTTSGWETLINSLLDSGLVITGAWPINTEMKERLLAQGNAALASSIYIIARKIEKNTTGFYNDIKEELRYYLNDKLDRLWEEGVVGADFFIAAIGIGIEIFGKYEKVIDYEGNTIRANKLLEDVRKIATDYAIKQILQNGFASEISKLTLFYVLWRWEFGEAKAPFDEARKLGQSVGIDISTEWGKYSFIKKDKEFIEVLNPKERKIEDLEGSDELIDVLHYCLLMWEKGNKDKILEILSITGFGKTDIFYRVAQAVSETLPNDSKEKKLLDGFLSGKEKLKKDISEKVVNKQQKLEDFT